MRRRKQRRQDQGAAGYNLLAMIAEREMSRGRLNFSGGNARPIE
jgi:hypothetical protein